MSLFDVLAKPFIKTETPTASTTEVTDTDAPAAGGRTFRLDTVGQVCPFPLVEAKQAISGLEIGDELVIDFDCTQATDSIPRWAADSGYPVTNFERVGDASWTITVQKA